MSIQATTGNLSTQAATQDQRLTDTEVRLGQQSTPTTGNNPAAEAYASQGMAIQSPGDDVPPPPGQAELEQEVNQLNHDILDKEMEIEQLETYLEELEYYLENAELTPEERVAVQELIEEGRHLKLDLELELATLQQTLELRQEELSQNRYGTADDWDGDGLDNEYELEIGTDVWKVDTDGDGLSDLVEDAMRRNGNLPIDPTQYSSTPNGVSDGVVFHDEAQEAANALGVPVNGPVAEGGSGQSVGPGIGAGNGTGETNGSGAPGNDGPPPPVGPTPGADAVQVEFSSTAADAGGAGAASAGAMGAQTADAGMAIQDGDEGDEEDEVDGPGEPADGEPAELNKLEVIEDLEGHVYEDPEIQEIEATLGNNNTYPDVVLNGEGQYVFTVEGNDVVVYHKSPEGEYKKIIIRQGRFRRIYVRGLTGNNDTIVYHNVPQQVIRGATQIVNGEHTYAAGIFIANDDGFAPGQVEQTPANEGGSSQWGYDYSVTSSVSDEAPEAPEVDGAENVWVVEELGRNSIGESSNRLEAIPEDDGGVYLEGEPGSQYLVEEYQVLEGEEQIYLHIPETVDGLVVKEIVVYEEGNKLVYLLKDSSGITRRKLVLRDGVTFGNTAGNGTQIITVLADGLNDPLGFSEQGYRFGGQEISYEGCTETYAYVLGGAGDDLITLSNYQGPDPTARYDFADGGTRNDIIKAGKSGATIHGGDGHDVILGSSKNDHITGDAGKDVIDGGFGADTLEGGGDDDFIVTRGTGNTVNGGSGWDITNIARNDAENEVSEDTDSALDELVAAGEMTDALIDMGLDPDTAVEARAQIEGWILSGEIDRISEKIHELFGMVLNIREEAWHSGEEWEGNGNMGESIGNMAGDPPSDDEGDEEGAGT